MNKLAQELNKKLEGSIADALLSDLGRRLYFPKGIAAQAGEARKQAHRFNATIGMAYEEGDPMILPSIKHHLPNMGPVEAVSYAPTGGVEELRELWKQTMVHKNPELNRDDISLPAVVPGLTNGICQTADLFVDPGDPVIVPDMFWGNYRLIFEVRREAEMISFPFFNREQTGFNTAAMTDAVRSGARKGKAVLLLNFPNNPTGYSPSNQEVAEIRTALKGLAEEGYKLLVIADDAYFGLFYEEDTFTQSLFSQTAQLHPNILAVKIDGATKEDFVWGFRVGFVTFSSPGLTKEHLQALTSKLTGSIRGTISNSSRVGQTLLLQAVKSRNYEKEKRINFEILKKRYRAVKEILSRRTEGKSLEPLPFNSGYFMTFRCRGLDPEQLRLKLLKEEGIGTIAIQGKYLRVAFSSIDENNLEEMFSLIFRTADGLA